MKARNDLAIIAEKSAKLNKALLDNADLAEENGLLKSGFRTLQFVSIIIFLRNSGSEERLRAIWLTSLCFQCGLAKARKWVDSVELVRTIVDQSGVRKIAKEYPSNVSPDSNENYLQKTVSHWPI